MSLVELCFYGDGRIKIARIVFVVPNDPSGKYSKIISNCYFFLYPYLLDHSKKNPANLHHTVVDFIGQRHDSGGSALPHDMQRGGRYGP